MLTHKYYPVFISSTKIDLEQTRLNLEHTLMRTQFLPIGMENFHASNKNVWEVITSRLDAASFVVLIIGDRYGDFDEESQKSYTQREYEYAKAHNIPVLAFVKDEPVQNNSYDIDTKKLEKLESFKKTVLDEKKLVHTWKESERENLPADILAALDGTLKEFLLEGIAPRGLVYDSDIEFYTRPKETIMNFYNVHAVIRGTKEDCDKGLAVVTYTGSALVDSPERPVIYEDRVKNLFPIISYKFFPAEEVINEDEFKRNPIMLDYRIVSKSNTEKLYFTGEISAHIQLLQEKAGILLHIPYFTETATIFLDISNVPFIQNYNGKPVVWRRDEKDGKMKEFNEAELIYNSENLTYAITARNIPADSNLGFTWNNKE